MFEPSPRLTGAMHLPRPSSRCAAAGVALIGIVLLCAGCVMVPITSPAPVRAEGIIDDDTLDSMLGLNVRSIIERVGLPDFAGVRGNDYIMVYQGEKEYRTNIHKLWVEDHVHYASVHYDNRPGDRTKVFHCQVIAFDDDRIARSYDVIVRPASGISRRDAYDGRPSPVSNCLEVVWPPDERDAAHDVRGHS